MINENDVKKFPQTNLSPLTKELFKSNSEEIILTSLRDNTIVMQLTVKRPKRISLSEINFFN